MTSKNYDDDLLDKIVLHGWYICIVIIVIMSIAAAFALFIHGNEMIDVTQIQYTLKDATVYGYELTPEDIRETRILETCIEFRIQSDTCSMIWGGLGTSNGEPIR